MVSKLAFCLGGPRFAPRSHQYFFFNFFFFFGGLILIPFEPFKKLDIKAKKPIWILKKIQNFFCLHLPGFNLANNYFSTIFEFLEPTTPIRYPYRALGMILSKKNAKKKMSLRGLEPVTLCTPIVVKSVSIPWKLGTKWLVLFFPADFLDTLKLSREQHEMGNSDGVGFFQEKSAGKKLMRLFVPNFLGLYSKLLPETWFWAVTKDV